MKPKSRPTPRAGTLLVAALVLYFFANQTQVGWLYVMSAVMAGCVAAARWVNRRALTSVTATRSLRLHTAALYPGAKGTTARLPDAIHVGDTVEIAIRLRAARDSAQIMLAETCPLVDEATTRAQTLYVPHLPRRGTVEYAYNVPVGKRGAHHFAPMRAASRAPFGIFERSGAIPADVSLLVYPEVRALRRLEMLDRRLAPQQPRARAGHGGEILGTRPYRPGDSPRHIHWRSSARQGQLISKEFADESQPALLLALDCFAHPYGSNEAFEIGVKIATTLGEYALRSGYRLTLLADGLEETPTTLVRHPASWHMLLETLARVQPIATRPLADGLRRQSEAQIAVVLPYPNHSLVPTLTALNASGVNVLSVVIGGVDCEPLTAPLRAVGIAVKHIRDDDDWLTILEESATRLHPVASPSVSEARP
jgi:uncharacterized protein (DUF58 family)